MNNTFSLNRFSLLFKRLMVERGIKMIGSIFMIIVLIGLFMSIELTPGAYTTIRPAFLAMGIMFGPIIYSRIVANEFSSNSKGISYLLIPSSRFEKWLLNNVVAVGLYVGIYTLLFYLLDTWMISKIVHNFSLPVGTIPSATFNTDRYLLPCLVGITFSIAILNGSLFFKKNGLVFTSLILLGSFLGIFIINYFVANIFFDGALGFSDHEPFMAVQVFSTESISGSFFVETPWEKATALKVLFISTIVLLSSSYFVRIKEKQL